MNIDTLNAALGIVASSLSISVTIAGFFVGSHILFKGRPPTHRVILAGSLLALLAVGLGFLFGTLPVISSADIRYAIANWLVVGGLLTTCLVWFRSLWISFYFRRWTWFFSVLLGGLIPYLIALVYAFTSFLGNTFPVGVAYIFAGITPGIFGFWGPTSSKEG